MLTQSMSKISGREVPKRMCCKCDLSLSLRQFEIHKQLNLMGLGTCGQSGNDASGEVSSLFKFITELIVKVIGESSYPI